MPPGRLKGEMYSYLTDNDEKRIEKVLSYYVIRSFYRPACPIYHYTTGENLINILESQEFWATQASCLNDTTELTYAAEGLRNCTLGRLSSSDKASAEFLKRVAEVLSNPYSETAGFFVTCFSEQQDDLSQWRAYSGGEGGYAIKVRPESLQIGDTGEILQILAPVNYRLEDHELMFNQVLEQGSQFSVELEGARCAPSTAAWLDEFVAYWLQQLQYLAPFLKNPKFESEKEWRLIYRLNDDDIEQNRMHFRQRHSMMTRHVSLRISKPLPITGVVIGPCRHPQLSRIAVGDLLKLQGYDPDVVKVSMTEVPYRTV
jgi:hypothetical protein